MIQNLSEFHSGADYDAQFGHRYDAEIAYLTQLAKKQSGAVLDVCCGTGIVTIPIARQINHPVHGVDLAEGMLAYAREKANNLSNLAWHHENALTFSLEQRFDLAIMTGNAFQAFLTDSAMIKVLHNINQHLNSSGLLVFDTRLMGYDRSADDDFALWDDYTDSQGRLVKYHGRKTRYDNDAQILYFDKKRVYPDGTISYGHIDLKFTSVKRLYEIFAETGFVVDAQYADWKTTPFDAMGTNAVFQLRKRN